MRVSIGSTNLRSFGEGGTRIRRVTFIALVSLSLIAGGCKSSLDRDDVTESEALFLDSLEGILWDERKILDAGYVACSAWEETVDSGGQFQSNVAYLLGNLGAGDSSQVDIPNAANRYLCPNLRQRAEDSYNSYAGRRGVSDGDSYPPEFDDPPDHEYGG